MTAGQQSVGPIWRDLGVAIALYIGFSAIGHLVWEVVQLPLYNLWHTASRGELAFAVLHCTAGDVLIAASVLVASLVVLRALSWPRAKVQHVAALAIPLGIAYTAFSEWHNVYVRQSWGYDPAMPTVTILGHEIGVSPLRSGCSCRLRCSPRWRYCARDTFSPIRAHQMPESTLRYRTRHRALWVYSKAFG